MKNPVIFDIDGTLVDSVDLHAEAWKEAFEEFGISIPVRRFREQIGKGGDQLLPVFLSPEQISAFGEKLKARRTDIWSERYMHRVRPFPCVRALFQALVAGGRRIALASSSRADELEIYKKLLEIEDLLAATTSADDAKRSKPHPDIFAAAVERLGMENAHPIVVGDSPYDAEAAGKIGLRCVGVLCGGFSKESLMAAGCDRIFRDPAGLLGNLEAWLD